MANAALDRIVNNSYRVVLEGDSYRKNFTPKFKMSKYVAFFLAALIKVDIEENKLLDPWHIEDTLEIKVNFLSFVSKVFV